jgi:hypothetical protein
LRARDVHDPSELLVDEPTASTPFIVLSARVVPITALDVVRVKRCARGGALTRAETRGR